MKKQIRRLILAVMIGVIAAGAHLVPADAASDTMKIVAVDLGAANTGEAVMVSDGSGNSLLVDSGDRNNRALFNWLDNNGYGGREFDTLVTHWHDDHAGNTAEVIRKYNVGTVYIPSLDYLNTESTQYYKTRKAMAEDVIRAAKENKTRIVYLKKGQTIDVGSVTGKVLYCNGSPAKENWYPVQYFNNQSAAIMFSGGGCRFLAAGDVQLQVEKRLLNSGYDLSADIFKISHHGYDSSNSQAFIEAVHPTYAYFTSHDVTPTNYISSSVQDSVTRLQKISNVMSTRYNGTITYTCSNGEISVKAGRNLKKMYQRLVNRDTGKSRIVTYTFNKNCPVNMTKKILDTDKYYNYQLNANGTMFTGGWSNVNDRYYMTSGGICAYNTFACKNGKTYWFDFYGRRFERGFKSVYGRRYYFVPHRIAGWKTVDGRRYYFMDGNYAKYDPNLEGSMMTGFKVISGKPYYLQDSRCSAYRPADYGKVMSGFFSVNGDTYYGANSSMQSYQASDYAVIQKEWTTINGRLYYMGSNGVIRKGWQTIGGRRYYMYPGGTTAINKFVMVDGKKYHFDENGVMQTGLITVDGKSYYMGTDGAMLTGVITEGGKTYCADEDGVLQKGFVTVGGKSYLFGDDYSAITEAGWHTIGGNTYYVLDTGNAAVGFTDIDGKRYYFNEEGVMQTGVITVDGRSYYMGPDGAMQTGRIMPDSGRRSVSGGYYADEDGVLQKGVVDTGDGAFLFGDDYLMVTAPGWADVEGRRYYISEDGSLACGFADIDGERFYFGSDFAAATGLFEADGKLYCADEDGVMQKGIIETEDGRRLFGDDYAMADDGGWYGIDGARYYIDDGGMFAEGITEIGEDTYLFDENGVMQTGFVVTDCMDEDDEEDDEIRFFNEDGVMQKGFFRAEEDGGTFYADEDGILQRGVVEDNGRKYLFRSDHTMAEGPEWVDVNGCGYYVHEGGEPAEGFTDIDGARYYFDENCVMQTGFAEIGGSTYYFAEDGAMAVGEVMIDGRMYRFLEDGTMDSEYPADDQ